MDVNGTKFHLLNGERDFGPLLEALAYDDLEWNAGRGGLGLHGRIPRVPRKVEETSPPRDPRLAVDVRRGADRDRFGNFYWIADDRASIRIAPSGDEETGEYFSVNEWNCGCDSRDEPGRVFRPIQDRTPALSPKLRGLAVTRDHYLIVGALDPAGLLIFDLHVGGSPEWRPWPDDVAFAPFDMSADVDGDVWILDRGPLEAESRLWKLDRDFCIATPAGDFVEIVAESRDVFAPIGESPRVRPSQTFPTGLLLTVISPELVANPVAVEALPDGSILLLDNEIDQTFSRIHRFVAGERREEFSLEGALETLLQPRESAAYSDLRAHDLEFLALPDSKNSEVRGSLFLIGDDGDQAFEFALRIDDEELELSPRDRYYPVRRFTGKGLVAGGRDVFYDFDDRWLPLAEQPRLRYPLKATMSGLVFDGKEPLCHWHRLLIDACIPEGCAIMVESRVAETPELLSSSPWRIEPPLHLRRRSEIPRHEPYPATHREPSRAGTWDLLLQDARGRFLELRLTFRGNQRSTPRVKALRVYYPRFSYLREYLPSVYQEDVISADFLDRFLANVESEFTTLEGRIAESESLFDPRTAPAEFLDWLAGWLGAAVDSNWDEPRRRLFLENLHLLYQWRGTLRGMAACVRLAVEECPDERIFDTLKNPLQPLVASGSNVRIVEHFLKRGVPGVALGDATEIEQPALLPPDTPWDPSQGSGRLHDRFREFLRRRYPPGDGLTSLQRLNAAWEREGVDVFQTWDDVMFPPIRPQHPPATGDWQTFIAGPIGFTYAEITAADGDAYRRFLRRRYGRVNRLNAAWQRSGDDEYDTFDDVMLPAETGLPESGRTLVDWIQFVSLVTPIRRHAHRFTVLVPARPGESAEVRNRRVDRVTRTVEREKPAHTVFDVKPFWALFQVGSIRLGLDTLLGEGSRFTALVLGESHLTHSRLAASHPWNVGDRRVVGRDPIEESDR